MWNLLPSCDPDETITNIFHTNEVFKLTSNEPVDESPCVRAIVRNHRMVISVNNNLFLLENENTIECNNVCFESLIDSMELNGSLVLCALRDGSIHGFHIQGHQLFNISIDDQDLSQIQTFIRISQVSPDEYLLMCSSGTLYRLSNIDEQKIFDSTEYNADDDSSSIDTTKLPPMDVQIKKVYQNAAETIFASFCVIPDVIPTILFASKSFIHVHRDDYQSKIKVPKFIKSVKAIYNLEHFQIGLSEDGQIFEICLVTNSINRIFELDYFVEDIVVLQISDDEIELLLQTKIAESAIASLKVVEFPSMKCHYDIPMTSHTRLVQQCKSSVNIYYLEEVANEDNGIGTEIVMKLIGETEPSERLKKLIQRGHLVEAETFASQNELSIQPIHEARAKKIIIEISSIPTENSKLIQEKCNALLELVKQITNTDFLLSLRNIDVTDKDTIKKILFLLLENIDFQKREKELGDIKEQLLRLDTLRLIDPHERYFEWQSFVHHKNLSKVITQLFEKNIDAACLIWKRHSASLTSDIDLEFAMKSDTLEPPEAIRWYRHFVPCMLQTKPEVMEYLVDNAIEKTRSLQLSNNWPDNGLRFITDVFEIYSEVKFLLSDTKRKFDDCISKLSSIVMFLQDLSVLKSSYSLTLTYDDYVNNSIEENAFNILLRVRLNHLKSLTRDFLYPIFFEKGLSPINTIIRFITFLVLRHKSIGFWQERAVAAVDLIYDEEKKLECALSILRVAPVPWSNTLTPLLQLGTSTHPLAVEIYNEYESQSLKIMKVKYGWQADSVGSIFKLAMRIVKINLPEIIDDLRYLVKVDSTQTFAINSYFTHSLLVENRIEKCIEFLNHLSDSECQNVCEFIVNIEDDALKMNDNVSEFYKYCKKRVNLNMKCELDGAISSRKLRSKFQLESSSRDFDETTRRDHLHKGIGKIINDLKTKQHSNLVHTSYNDVTELCNCIKFEPLLGIVELTKTLDNIYFTCGIAKIVLELITVNEHNYSFFIDLAVLLIGQQIQSLQSVLPTNMFSYLLAYKLLQQSLKYGIVVYNEINDLLAWCVIGCDIYSLTEIDNFLQLEPEFDKNMLSDPSDESGSLGSPNYSFSVFESVLTPKSINKATNNNEEILTCLSSAVNLMCITNSEGIAFSRINKYFELNNDSSEEILERFMSSLNNLIKRKEHSGAFKIIQLILKYQKLGDLIIITDAYLSTFIKKILKYALQQKSPNFLYLTAVYMSDLNRQNLSTYLENELKDSQSYINYLKFCEFCNAIIQDFHLTIEPGSIFKCQYYNELCKHDPSFKLKKNVNFHTFDNVVDALNNKVLSLSLLKRMSEAFSWDYQEVLVTQILAILSNQELEYDVNIDMFGKEEVIFKNSIEPLCDLCEIYINELACKSNLAEKLHNFMKTINFYFYELFLCVISILELIKATTPEMNWWRSILKFLKHKMTSKRIGPISQIENEAWLKSHSLSGGMPPRVAKYRLPFLLLVSKSLTDILNDEVFVENYDKWFPLIELHAQMDNTENPEMISITKDKFCMLAVKNSISEHKNKLKQESAVYNLQPKNNAFLQSILRLITHMKGEINILFVLYFITNHTPEGADQVEAAYECYKFAMKTNPLSLSDRRGAEILSKIKIKYPMCKTIHLLHLYGLSEDKLFRLAENPNELIWALYGHESFLKQRKLDINKLAEEIADLHDISLKKIQLQILQKWFVGSANNGTSADETFCGDLDASYTTDGEVMNEDVTARAYYILCHWPIDEVQEFCIAHINDDKNPAKQLLACECYLKFSNADDEMLDSSQFNAVKCVYYLNQLGYKLTPQKFINYDKNVILKKIWSSHASDSRALEVITYISMGFDIYIPKLWSGVLKQMVALNMVKQLHSIIELISRRPELRSIDDGLVAAWQCLIKEPFETANKIRSPEQEARLRKSLFLCQACPVISKIDLVDIAKQYIYLQRSHMAAVLLAFANDQQKVQISDMVKKNAPKLIKEEILLLRDFGMYSFVIDLVLSELEL